MGMEQKTLAQDEGGLANIVDKTLRFSRLVAKRLQRIEESTVDYQHMVSNINHRLDEKNLLVDAIINNEDDFIAFQKALDNLTLNVYQILPYGNNTIFKEDDMVRTFKALNGDTYFRGTTLEELSLGTLGKLDDDLDFRNQTGEYFDVTLRELQRVKRIVLNEGADYQGKKAEIVNLNNGCVQTGDWGYIKEEIGAYYKIELHAMHCNQHTLPETRKMEKRHVKIIEAELTAEEKKKIQDKNRGIIETITEAVNEEKVNFERYQRELGRIRTAVEVFRGRGIEDEIINAFFAAYSKDVNYLERKGIIPSANAFREIDRAIDKIDYHSIADRINILVTQELGIVFSSENNVEDKGSYAKFKEGLIETILRTGGRYDQMIDTGIKKGDLVMVFDEGLDMPLGAIGKYIRPYEEGIDDDHIIDFGDQYQTEMNIEGKILKLEPIFEGYDEIKRIEKGMGQELIEGTKVRIRRDSVYAHQNTGEGRIKQVREHTRDHPFVVAFEDGYNNHYHKEDLEFANPVQELTGEQQKIYQERKVALDKKTHELKGILTPIFITAENSEETYQRLEEMTIKCVNKLESIGIEKSRILQLFKDNVSNHNYLERDILM